MLDEYVPDAPPSSWLFASMPDRPRGQAFALCGELVQLDLATLMILLWLTRVPRDCTLFLPLPSQVSYVV